jgi:hypothetical protein
MSITSVIFAIGCLVVRESVGTSFGRDQGIEVVGSKLDERLGAVDSGVIHQNIDSTEVLDRCFVSFTSGLLLPDIAIDENQAG